MIINHRRCVKRCLVIELLSFPVNKLTAWWPRPTVAMRASLHCEQYTVWLYNAKTTTVLMFLFTNLHTKYDTTAFRKLIVFKCKDANNGEEMWQVFKCSASLLVGWGYWRTVARAAAMNWPQQTPCLGNWASNVKVWLLHLRPSRRSFHVRVLKGTK